MSDTNPGFAPLKPFSVFNYDNCCHVVATKEQKISWIEPKQCGSCIMHKLAGIANNVQTILFSSNTIPHCVCLCGHATCLPEWLAVIWSSPPAGFLAALFHDWTPQRKKRLQRFVVSNTSKTRLLKKTNQASSGRSYMMIKQNKTFRERQRHQPRLFRDSVFWISVAQMDREITMRIRIARANPPPILGQLVEKNQLLQNFF